MDSGYLLFNPKRGAFGGKTEYNLSTSEGEALNEIRKKIPVIDACIQKIIRLVGEFEVKVSDEVCQKETDRFLKEVKVGGSATGIKQFIGSYLEQLLVYGNAIGEIIPKRNLNGVEGLYNASCDGIVVKEGESPFEPEFYVRDDFPFGKSGERKIESNDFILFTPLNPKSGEIVGRPILEGLDFMGSILLKIFTAVGKSYERLGDLRYAVSYLPKGELTPSETKALAKELSNSWARVMEKDGSGAVSDFLAVGDIDIKKIGADGESLDVKEPIRCVLEEIIAKLGIPPFMLGISWSSTERMSKQQADILTSEIKNYRQLLSPAIEKICKINLKLQGLESDIEVIWKSISLDDEVEIARAKLIEAQADSVKGKGDE